MREDGIITALINSTLAYQCDWYEGKLELDIIPRMKEKLRDRGIDIQSTALKSRILSLYPKYSHKSMPYE